MPWLVLFLNDSQLNLILKNIEKRIYFYGTVIPAIKNNVREISARKCPG